MSDIFISYKREEQPEARKLADALEKKGWSVWWDPKLRAGEHFDDAIERALNDAKCVIVMWSKLSVESRYVRDEAAYALKRNKLVPIAIEEVDLPFRFEGVQTGQLLDWDGSDSFLGFQKLVEDIASIIGETPILVKERKLKKRQAKREAKKKRKLKETGEEQIPKEVLEHKADTGTFKNSIGMEFVLIPTGSFMMGSHVSTEEAAKKYGAPETWFQREHPQHKVTISQSFYLQSTTVTQSQWKMVLGNNPSGQEYGDDCPVENVSWNDVQDFIKKLNEMEGADNYRLPTEAEWEYACRSGTTTDFSFGEDASKLAEYAWYSANSEHRTHPVGKKKPNAWNLYDMHGNIYEWVEDDWHETYDGAPADGSAWVVKKRSAWRVMRGGSWFNDAQNCRSTDRVEVPPDLRDFSLGFRLVRSITFDA